jgi:hypothetical protein
MIDVFENVEELLFKWNNIQVIVLPVECNDMSLSVRRALNGVVD